MNKKFDVLIEEFQKSADLDKTKENLIYILLHKIYFFYEMIILILDIIILKNLNKK